MYIVENPNKVCPMNMNEYIYFQSIVPGSNPYENSCFGNNGRSNHILNFKLQYIKHFTTRMKTGLPSSNTTKPNLSFHLGTFTLTI